jgi:hypothetical protein
MASTTSPNEYLPLKSIFNPSWFSLDKKYVAYSVPWAPDTKILCRFAQCLNYTNTGKRISAFLLLADKGHRRHFEFVFYILPFATNP